MSRPLPARVGGEGPRRPPILVAVAAGRTAADLAVAAGADLVDLGGATAREVTDFTARHPGVPFRAADEPAGPPGGAVSAARGALAEPAQTRRTDRAGGASGPLLVCDSLAAARRTGLPPRLVAVAVADAATLAEVRAAGHATCVDADADADGADGAAAAASLATWLGADLIRTAHPLAVRRAIDMTLSIAGLRAPARAVRGLA